MEENEAYQDVTYEVDDAEANDVDVEIDEDGLSIEEVEVDQDIPLSDEEEFAYKIIKRAAMLQGVKIHRDVFLRTELIKKCPAEVVDAAVASTPQKAGISIQTVDELADASIRLETAKVTGISALAGIPGGLAMVGTIPADIAQYFAHALRIEQKLAYLYGWESFLNDEDEIDDETMTRLILFLGIVMQVGSVANTLTKFVAQTAKTGVAKAIERQALTKTAWYMPMKKILRVIGVKVTKSSFAEVVSKGVPVIGGAVSGGLTYATFKPGAVSLKKYLRALPQATGIEMTDEELEATLKQIEEESKNEFAEAVKSTASAAGDKAGQFAGTAAEKAGNVAGKAGAAAKDAASGLKRGLGGLSSRFGQRRKKGSASSSDMADAGAQLRALKELLDEGIITQEDYDAKKRELLGL